MRVWWNWQTRMIQVHMPLQACRFKSCHPHHQLSAQSGREFLFSQNNFLTFESPKTTFQASKMTFQSFPLFFGLIFVIMEVKEGELFMKKKSIFFVLALTAILFLLHWMDVINWPWYLLCSPVWVYLGALSGSIHQKIHMHDLDEHRKANNGWFWRP